MRSYFSLNKCLSVCLFVKGAGQWREGSAPEINVTTGKGQRAQGIYFVR